MLHAGLPELHPLMLHKLITTYFMLHTLLYNTHTLFCPLPLPCSPATINRQACACNTGRVWPTKVYNHSCKVFGLYKLFGGLISQQHLFDHLLNCHPAHTRCVLQLVLDKVCTAE